MRFKLSQIMGECLIKKNRVVKRAVILWLGPGGDMGCSCLNPRTSAGIMKVADQQRCLQRSLKNRNDKVL